MTDTAEQLSLQQSHVMVVDDDAPVCEAFRRALVRGGYVARVANDFNHAMAILRENPLDTVVSDIFLGGGLNGLDILEQCNFKTNLSELPRHHILIPPPVPDTQLLIPPPVPDTQLTPTMHRWG